MNFTPYIEQIKENILDNFEKAIGQKIDRSPSSFISILAHIIALADQNVLFYLAYLFNETNLLTATIPDNILRNARLLGYKRKRAVPASGTVSFYINIDPSQDFETVISPSEHYFTYGNTVYYPKYTYVIKYYAGDKSLVVYYIDENENWFLGTGQFQHIDGNTYIVANIEVVQEEFDKHEFTVTDYAEGDFYRLVLRKPDYYVTQYKVYVNGQLINEVEDITYANPNEYCYVVEELDTTCLFVFSNGVFGKRVKPGDTVEIHVYYTRGSKGNCPENSLQLATTCTNLLTGEIHDTFCKNYAFTNGKDEEDVFSVKRNALLYFYSKDRIISVNDFENIAKILNYDDVTATWNYALTLQTTLYPVLYYNFKPLKTNTITLKNVLQTEIPQGSIVYTFDKKYNRASFIDSSLFTDTPNYIQFNESGVIPFALRYDSKLKIFKYYRYLHGISLPWHFLISKPSETDGVSLIQPSTLAIQYNQGYYQHQLTLQFFSLDLSEENYQDDLEIHLALYNQDTGELITQLDNSDYNISFDPNGFIYINFTIPSNLLKEKVRYKWQCLIFYKGEQLVSAYIDNIQYIYEFPYIWSYVDEYTVSYLQLQYNIYSTDPTIKPDKCFLFFTNNEPEEISVYSDMKFDPDNYTHYLITTNYEYAQKQYIVLDSNYSLEESKEYYLYQAENTYLFDRKTNKMIPVVEGQGTTVTIIGNVYKGNVESFYAGRLRVQYPKIELKEYKEVALVKVLNIDPSIYIEAFKIPADLKNIPSQKAYTIYGVPILEIGDYYTLTATNSFETIYATFDKLYSNAYSKLPFSTQCILRFAKTWGYISNIRFNSYRSPITYDPQVIDSTNIELPLKLTVTLLIDRNFKVSLLDTIKNDLFEFMKTKSGFDASIYRDEIRSILLKYPGVVEVVNISLPFDIVYRYKLDDVANQKEYVPEYISIQDVNDIEIKLQHIYRVTEDSC